MCGWEEGKDETCLLRLVYRCSMTIVGCGHNMDVNSTIRASDCAESTQSGEILLYPCSWSPWPSHNRLRFYI